MNPPHIQLFFYLAIAVLTIWCMGVLFLFITKHPSAIMRLGLVLMITGTLLILIYIIKYWLIVERPPLKTLGETRLWYVFFLSAIGIFMYFKWRWRWIFLLCIPFASLFLVLLFFSPETFDKTLMPALQSVWFIPHVITYILSYSFLTISMLIAILGLFKLYFRKEITALLVLSDTIVYTGFSFLTFGLLIGALWAKDAWGNYWTWDIKETWALITWLVYLIYIHLRQTFQQKNVSIVLWILLLAFVVIMICWFGINYLPSAADSVHTYTNP